VYPIDADDRAFAAFLGLRKAWEWVKDNQAVGPKMSPTRLRQWYSPAAETVGEDFDRRALARQSAPLSFPAGESDA
jgi:hypothetical protein